MPDPSPPPVVSLWIGGPLSFIEQLCLASHVRAGHRVTLYSYEPIPNLPEGVRIADAGEILEGDNILTHGRTGSPALQSDRFRFLLLAAEPGAIWADTDALCLRPLTPVEGHLHGWESPHRINGGVLALPPESAALAELLDFTDDQHPIPPWFPADQRAELAQARDAGAPVHAGELSWGIWGPQALTHFLQATGEVRFSLPTEALYPIPFAKRRQLLKPGRRVDRQLNERTQSVHLYGRRLRARLVEREGGLPHEDSYLGRALRDYGIDPRAAPIRLPPRREAA